MSAGYDAAGNPDGTRNMNPAGIGFWALVAAAQARAAA